MSRININKERIEKDPFLNAFLHATSKKHLAGLDFKSALNNKYSDIATGRNDHLELGLISLCAVLGKHEHLRFLAQYFPEEFNNSDIGLAYVHAANNGHLEVLQTLETHMSPEDRLSLLKENKYFIYRLAAKNGHVEVLQHFETLVSEEEARVMVRAEDEDEGYPYAAYIDAAVRGRLDVMKHLEKKLQPLELLALLKYEHSRLYCELAKAGQVEILQHFEMNACQKIDELTPEEKQQLGHPQPAQWIEELRRAAARQAGVEKHPGVMRHLLNSPLVIKEFIDFATAAASKSIIHEHVDHILAELQAKISEFKSANPDHPYDCDEAELEHYYFLLKFLIKDSENSPVAKREQVSEQINLLLSMPSIQKSLPQAGTTSRKNELLRLAVLHENMSTARTLLAYPAVREQAKRDNFYELLSPSLASQLRDVVAELERTDYANATKDGNVEVLKILETGMSEEARLALLRKDNYSIYRLAARTGHVSVLQHFEALVSEEEACAMVRAKHEDEGYVYAAYHDAAANGHVDVLRHLETRLPPEETLEMFNTCQLVHQGRSYSYAPYQAAAIMGHVDVLKHIETTLPRLTRQLPEVFQQQSPPKLWKQKLRFSAAWLAQTGENKQVVKHLLNTSSVVKNLIDYGAKEPNEKILYQLIRQELIQLQQTMDEIQRAQPGQPYDCKQKEANNYYLFLKFLIKHGANSFLAEPEQMNQHINLLLSIPAVQTLLPNAVTTSETNELLRFAMLHNKSAARALLAFPAVKAQAEQDSFYEHDNVSLAGRSLRDIAAEVDAEKCIPPSLEPVTAGARNFETDLTSPLLAKVEETSNQTSYAFYFKCLAAIGMVAGGCLLVAGLLMLQPALVVVGAGLLAASTTATGATLIAKHCGLFASKGTPAAVSTPPAEEDTEELLTQPNLDSRSH